LSIWSLLVAEEVVVVLGAGAVLVGLGLQLLLL
jgi:hypothetical protein